MNKANCSSRLCLLPFYYFKCLLCLHAFLCLLPFCANAQYLAPEGAKWYSRTLDGWLPPFTMVTSQTVMGGDANVGGQDCKVAEVSIYGWCEFQYQYLYEDSGIVYFYNQNIPEWDTLYNFNAIAGDTWSYAQGLNSFTVDSVGYLVLAGDTLKVLYVNSGERIIQRIGHSYIWWSIPVPCDPDYSGPVSCYEDSVLGVFHWMSEACDTTYLILSDRNTQENVLKLQANPNPFQDEIQLSWIATADVVLIEIFDAKGISLLRQNRTGMQAVTIETKDWPEGLYFVRIETAGKAGLKRLVKM
jgi:Secretion system C-terminal sorting domain